MLPIAPFLVFAKKQLVPSRGTAVKRFFAGGPIVDSFNHSIFFGLFFPLDFKTLLGGKK